MMSAMNMRGAFAYQAGTSIVPDTVVKQEIIKLSQAVENTTYPCVYFCNLYGHSFHVTNTKMRNFLCSSDSQANIAATFMERRPFSNAAGKQTDPTLHCGKEAAAPPTHSPFKTMIGSMLNCDATLKDEVISTFMGNSLFKSDRTLKSYWSNVPPVQSFQTTFAYERIPILDYISLMPMQTTLLVDLSRSANGETFLHKIYFTNIQPRVVAPLSQTTVPQVTTERDINNILTSVDTTQRNIGTNKRSVLAEDKFALTYSNHSQPAKSAGNSLPGNFIPVETSKVSLSAASRSESKEACRTNKEPTGSLLAHQFPPGSSTASQTVLYCWF